jgi:hypothetical protein
MPQQDQSQRPPRRIGEPGMNAKILKGAILPPAVTFPVLQKGIERIREKSPCPVDILHERAVTDPCLRDYGWVLDLDGNAAPTSRNGGSTEHADAWAVEVSGSVPKVVRVRGETERARLYAMYHVADCLAAGTPPPTWSAHRRPLVPKRYALVTAGCVWSQVCRPDLFDRAIVELPGMGFNGVIIGCTPVHGTSIGRQTLPFTLTEDGVAVDRFKIPMFQSAFDRIKSYGLDICLFHQAYLPPPFTMEQVREHYAGKRDLPGFAEAAREGHRALADAIFTHFPQVNALLHHSLECEWFWGNAVSIFPCRDDAAGERALAAHLEGLSDACARHGKDLLFWTHVCGIDARQLRLLRQVLSRFPSVIAVEDNAWENCCWPHAPVMGYLSEDLKQQVTSGRFGLAINTTDGEYFGAGKLPSSYPAPHVRGAKAAADLGAEFVYVRLNGQMLTPLGTLDDVNAINVLAVGEALWTPARPLDECWLDWCSRRFGVAAAPAVVSALKKSGDIITKGLSASRLGLIDHSGLSVGKWQPRTRNSAWTLFATDPGKLVVDKPYDDLTHPDFKLSQVDAAGVALDTFLRDSAEADAAAREALREIASARADLKPEDFIYLTGCFEDAIVFMEAVRRTASGASASALCLERYDAAHERRLEEACAAMEAYADWIEENKGPDFCRVHFFMKAKLAGNEYPAYSVPIALRAIAERYRECRGTGDTTP